MNEYQAASWGAMAKNITWISGPTDQGPDITFRPTGPMLDR